MIENATYLAGAQRIVDYIPRYFESVVKGAPPELEAFAKAQETHGSAGLFASTNSNCRAMPSPFPTMVI